MTPSRLRLLLITPYFPPEVGSAAHLYFELGQALQARGHEVLVLTGLPRYHVLDRPQPRRRRPAVWETYRGLPVLRAFNLDIPWNRPLWRGLDQFLFAGLAGLTGLALPSFDVAMVYSPPLPLALAALALGRLRRRPVVLNIQDLFPQSAIDLGVLRHPWLIRFFRRLETFLYRQADLTICHSQGNRDYILRSGGKPEQVRVVPNWIDTEALGPASRQTGLRQGLGLTHHFIVSFAGVMGYSQDLETVLQCAGLLRDHADIAFLLVGDGVEKAKLMALAGESRLPNVHFLPMQPKEKYGEVLATSDLCLATLRPEVRTPVVPSKILSIMAAGRPVLASLPLEGDAPRLINEAQCGMCVPPGDPKVLAEAVLKFFLHQAWGEALGAKGRGYAVQHLSLKRGCTILEHLFHQVHCEASFPLLYRKVF